jgi:hypothetical protein
MLQLLKIVRGVGISFLTKYPPCINGLKLAFVTIFLYGASKAKGKSISPSGSYCTDNTVPVTVTH